MTLDWNPSIIQLMRYSSCSWTSVILALGFSMREMLFTGKGSEGRETGKWRWVCRSSNDLEIFDSTGSSDRLGAFADCLHITVSSTGAFYSSK